MEKARKGPREFRVFPLFMAKYFQQPQYHEIAILFQFFHFLVKVFAHGPH